ncbi:MAG: hypothetical protein KDB88_06330 [Flavobacteriales bacterium]|nr:hypothetical protein [Flavobacteriales bacterium]
MKRALHLLANLGISLTAFVLVLVICELVLRAFGHQDIYTASSYPKELFDSSSVSGMRPGFVGAFRSSEVEGEIRINSVGFRDRERSYKPDSSTCRVLGIGDSFGFAHGLPPDQGYLALLEQDLQGIMPGMEVLNACVPGRGPNFYLDLLQRIGPEVRPDVVLMGFFVGNDLDGIVAQRDPHRSDPGINANKTWLRRNIHLYSFVADRMKSIPFVRRMLKGYNISTGLIGAQAIDVLRTEESADFKAGWERLEDVLRAMKGLAPGLVVVAIPTVEQVESDRLVQALERLEYQPSEVDVRHPMERLSRMCSQLGIAQVDLLGPMTRRYAKDHEALYFEIDPHFNARGHAAAADVLAAAFRSGMASNGIPMPNCPRTRSITSLPRGS